VAYFGQKDAQQVAVIRQVVRDFNLPVDIRVGSTVRDPDGLALSSRNIRLSAAERVAALANWPPPIAGPIRWPPPSVNLWASTSITWVSPSGWVSRRSSWPPGPEPPA
jgi:hypothetical protein